MEWLRKYYAWAVFSIVVVSFIPILYCGWFAYASADEFSKSYLAHDAVLAGQGFLDVLRAGVQAAINQWETIEGTWSSNFVMSIQPSIYGERWYAITVPLCILYITAGAAYFFYEVLVIICGISRKAYVTVMLLQVFLVVQYMPYIRGGLFWYVGMVHYYMPTCIALFMITWMLKWTRTGHNRYYVYMLCGSIYMGGSHYQHILVMIIAFVTFGGWKIVTGSNRLEQDEQDHTQALLNENRGGYRKCLVRTW